MYALSGPHGGGHRGGRRGGHGRGGRGRWGGRGWRGRVQVVEPWGYGPDVIYATNCLDPLDPDCLEPVLIGRRPIGLRGVGATNARPASHIGGDYPPGDPRFGLPPAPPGMVWSVPITGCFGGKANELPPRAARSSALQGLGGDHRAPPASECTSMDIFPLPGGRIGMRRRTDLAGFGDVDPWSCMSCHMWSASDVYVLRFTLVGATISDARDALRFVQAAGQDQNLRLDVRGIAVSAAPAGGAGQQVDVIFTVQEGGLAIPFLADSPMQIAKAMASDPDLVSAYPRIAIPVAVFGRLTAPASALDHWRSQAVLWSATLPGPRGRGGPTDAIAMPAPLALVRGTAESGKLAVPLPGAPTQTPIGGPGKKPGPGAELDWTTIGLGFGALALGAGALYYARKRSSAGPRGRGA